MGAKLPRIRNAVFYAQCTMFATMMCIMGEPFFFLCALFGAAGLGVLLLTLKVREPVIQKVFFVLAGSAGAAALVTLAVFHILAWSGRTPGGDGGGITVAMLLLVCPALFLVGVTGSTACRIRAKSAARKMLPDKPVG